LCKNGMEQGKRENEDQVNIVRRTSKGQTLWRQQWAQQQCNKGIRK
jgi:hypothetical protein